MTDTQIPSGDPSGREAARARTEAVMLRRAAGDSVRGIAEGLRIDVAVVRKTIDNRRAAGDPRALTAVEAERVRAAAPAPGAAEPGTAPAGPEARRREADKVRALAGRLAPFGRGAVQSANHLADLYEHCSHTYPQMAIAGSDVVLTTPRPAHAITSASSPALACILAG